MQIQADPRRSPAAHAFDREAVVTALSRTSWWGSTAAWRGGGWHGPVSVGNLRWLTPPTKPASPFAPRRAVSVPGEAADAGDASPAVDGDNLVGVALCGVWGGPVFGEPQSA